MPIRLEENATTDLSELEVRRRDRHGHEWVMASPTGRSDITNDMVQLEGGVQVSRADGVTLHT
jgi:hypothetical protein